MHGDSRHRFQNMATYYAQHQRLELKYIVYEQTALAVRDFVSSYLTIDKFSAGQPDFSYPIHSLYLDSDCLIFYWHTINGNKDRFKLRLRYYDDQPSSPVFFEIKRRVNGAILKQRSAVNRDVVDALLAGQLLGPDEFFPANPDSLIVLGRFCQLMLHHAAKPKAHVAYRREAWVSCDQSSTRVTMDRQVQFAPESTTSLRTKMHNPVRVFPGKVVLELKFTDRFPNWFAELVRHFNLQTCSAAKYADGITVLMESGRGFGTLVVPPEPGAEEKLLLRRKSLKENQLSIEPMLI
jgi:hypothetical protein